MVLAQDHLLEQLGKIISYHYSASDEIPLTFCCLYKVPEVR
jgi:hypothetical protein